MKRPLHILGQLKANRRRVLVEGFNLLVVVLLTCALFWPAGRQVIVVGINACTQARDSVLCLGYLLPWVGGLLSLWVVVLGLTLRVFFPELRWPWFYQGLVIVASGLLLVVLIYASIGRLL